MMKHLLQDQNTRCVDETLTQYEKPNNESFLIQELINQLLNGSLTPADFRIAIQTYNRSRVISLFRDSFPKFPTNYKIKLAETFSRYFYGTTVPTNQFWSFVNYSKFWTEIKIFHDIYYDRSLRLNHFLTYLRRSLILHKLSHNLTPLEKKILKILQKKPDQTCKEIASQIRLSQKSISQVIKKLKEKQIQIGSLVSYSAIGLTEYFIEVENFKHSIYENTFVYLENNFLFPNNKKLCYGISRRKIKSANFYEVLDKKYSVNLSLIQEPYTLKWALSQDKPRSKAHIVCAKKDILTTKTSWLKEHTIMLLRNCEKDFKKPEYQQISRKCNVSIRTLLREKSRFLKEEIIKPCLDTTTKALIYLFIKSNIELSKLYDYLPVMKSFKVSNNKKDILWISKVGVLPADLPTLLNYLHGWTEVSIINSRQIIIDKTVERNCY